MRTFIRRFARHRSARAGAASILALLVTAAALIAGPGVAQAETAPCDGTHGFGIPTSATALNGTLPTNNYLYAPNVLRGRAGLSYLESPNQQFLLRMQDDGNLVLYQVWGQGYLWCGSTAYRTFDGLYPLWSSDTGHDYTVYVMAVMQADGNLVVGEPGWGVDWASGTGDRATGPYTLRLQDDGNLVIYIGSQAIWARA